MKENKLLLALDYIHKYFEYVSLLKLRTKDYRVYLYLFSKISFNDEFTKINQTTIRDELNLSKSEVSKAIRALIDIKLLVVDKGGEYINLNKLLKLNKYTFNELDTLILEAQVSKKKPMWYDEEDNE